MDLNTVITGSLEQIYEERSTFTALRDFTNPAEFNDSFMAIPPDVADEAYDTFMLDAEDTLGDFHSPTDFLRHTFLQRPRRWQTILPGQVISYNVHNEIHPDKPPPANTRVVIFNGRPRPWEALSGWVSQYYL